MTFLRSTAFLILLLAAAQISAQPHPVAQPKPRVLLCYGDPWVLADTAQWSDVSAGIDVFKFYVDGVEPSRVGREQIKSFLAVLLQRNIRIAVEIGGLVDWHADKGDRSAEFSFRDEFAKLKPFIALIKEVDSARNIDMLDMDGPIRRMLFPGTAPPTPHTLSTAVTELFKVAAMWRDSIPGVELNLLVNFPNWAWGNTPAYYEIEGDAHGFGQYMDVLDSVQARSLATGLRFDGLTIDNPYDYAIGAASSNQPAVISGVDWMQRLAELDAKARGMGLKVNMIFNTNGGRNAKGYSDQTLAFLDLYRARVGTPDGYWVQSWYQLPGAWLPETTPYTMTHLTRDVLRKLGVQQQTRALLEPEDGRVYHGAQLMTYESGDPLAGYLGAVADPALQPAVRGLFFSIPGTRGPAQSLRGLIGFLASADSIGFIPELSLFLVSDVATDSAIAVSNTYDWIIDSIATLAAKYGRRMFLRIGGEFNGAGPGWNGGGYHPYLYVTMFRKITDRFAAKGMRDSVATIWCYYPAAANDFDSVDARGARWYPGDAYVDWFGLDLFDPQDFDLSLPDSVRGAITRKGKSERFLAMAGSKGKPVYMSETSAKGINISADPADGIADWNAWFAKFWGFIDAHIGIKGFSYINANWPTGAYPGWGDARIQNSPYVIEHYREEMRRPKYIHLPWSAPSALDQPAIAAEGITIRQLSPLPVTSVLTAAYTLPRAATLRVVLVDILGREVLLLDAGMREAGAHMLQRNVSALPTGMYVLRVVAPGLAPASRPVLLAGRH